MNKSWPLALLGDVLRERQEVPSTRSIENGQIRIISKIGFDSGKIEFRSGTQTKTKMIGIQPGDLVLSGINAAKGAIAIYSKDENQPAAATIHYGAYEVLDDKADRSYLWWLLRSRLFRDILASYLPGGIKTELKAKRLLPVEVPLPPISEQQRIVTRIERLAAKIQEAKSLRAFSCKHSKAFVRARLNEISRQFETYTELYDVLTERPRNGWSARCDNAEDGTPVLALSAVTGYHYRSTAYKKTSIPTDPEAHYWLKPGDLLITRSNTPDLVGHAAIYDGNPGRCIYPDLMMRIPVDEKVASIRFVWFWLQSSMVRDFIYKNSKGTSPTMKKISQAAVMKIPFPRRIGLEEQHKIVEELESLQGKVGVLQSLLLQTSARLDDLLPSILGRAFTREL